MSLVVEKDIESYLKRLVEDNGGKCIKFPAVYEEGIPDRLVIIPMGKIAFVELKRPKGGRLSAIQKYQIDKLKKLGCRVYVVWNKEDAESMLKEIIKDEI